jgi:serine/threonine-protein kinase HipA
MECGDLGRFANARNIVSQHARFLLEKSEAEKIVNDTRNQVEKWYDTVRACGVSETDAETIHGAFLYPGFSL